MLARGWCIMFTTSCSLFFFLCFFLPCFHDMGGEFYSKRLPHLDLVNNYLIDLL
jgi:hypothetical protein